MSSQEPTHRSFSTNQFFGRNPYDRSHRRYISSDDCPSSHDGSFADGDSRHYHSMDPYKGAPLNDCRGNLCWTPAGIGLRLVMGKYRGFSRYSGSFLDRHEVRVQIVNDHAITDLDLTADPHATGTVERDAKRRARAEPRGEEEACRAQALSHTASGPLGHRPRMPRSRLCIHRGQILGPKGRSPPVHQRLGVGPRAVRSFGRFHSASTGRATLCVRFAELMVEHPTRASSSGQGRCEGP